MNILALETSSTSAKAMIYTTPKNNYSMRSKILTKVDRTKGIGDAEAIFNETIELGRQVCEGKQIDIIALSSSWHSLLLCDEYINPETPVFLWSFKGASTIAKELRMDTQFSDWFYSRTGCVVSGVYPAFKLLYLKKEGFKLKDYFIMDQGTYNMYRLTNEKVIMDSMASGMGLMNIHTKKFDEEILGYIGINEDHLSQMSTYRDIRPLSKEGAKLLDLKEGIPVIPTGPDGGLNQVGAGALKEGIMTFSAGTSGALRLTTSKPNIPNKPSTWCYLSPKNWLIGAATSGCCNCIDWYKDNMFHGNITYNEIEEGFMNRTSTPVFLPFLFGERSPGWHDDRKAGVYDLKPYHTTFDIYHGVMEGILFNLYQCYEELVKINGYPNKIKLSGGILNSVYWTQMCADIFRMDMEVDDIKHSSLLGAVALGLELVNEIDDAGDLIPKNIKKIKTNPNTFELYEKKYGHYRYWYEKTIS